MTPERFRRIEQVFEEVRAAPPAQRDGLLEDRCANDPGLKSEVRALLETLTASADFLATPALGASIAPADIPAEENLTGQRFGPWQVGERIAAGGMGAVYHAQRADQQFEQRVAIKVVKRGLDTDEVLKRFKSERQTLAGLNHPNIARLLDGGATHDGRPYLVMELVQGKPIDEFCDAKNFGVRERVELLKTVCQAVQAAHQALIIHRDLKPSNILVDDRGVPKLLDFGIAKVLDTPHGTSAQTITGQEQRRLTPEYASPEQIRGEPIGTASDVYSLGVVLYEVLSGKRPLDVSSGSLAEIERTVCFVTPELPSTAALKAGPEAARRATALRGDLDTIILMALRKEPARRYPTVDALIADLDRYLQGRPVAARPDTFGYRAHKFVSRNPVLTAMTAAVTIAIVGGVSGTLYQYRVATIERDNAIAQQREADRSREQAEEALDFLREGLAAADLENKGPMTPIGTFLAMAADDARVKFAAKPLTLAIMLDTVGRAQIRLSDLDGGRKAAEEAFAIRQNNLPEVHHDLAESHLTLGELHYALRNHEDALKHLLRSKDIYEQINKRAGESLNQADLAEVWNDLGVTYRAAGRIPEAIDAHNTALALRQRVFGEQHLKYAESLNNLASAQADPKGDFNLARENLGRSIAIRRARLRPDHPLIVQSIGNLAAIEGQLKQFDSAVKHLQEAVALCPGAYGKDSAAEGVFNNTLGSILFSQEKFEDAAGAYRVALRIRRALLGDTHQQTLITQSWLGASLLNLKESNHAEGESLLTDALTKAADPAGKLAARWKKQVDALAAYLESKGQTAEAERWRRALASP